MMRLHGCKTKMMNEKEKEKDEGRESVWKKSQWQKENACRCFFLGEGVRGGGRNTYAEMSNTKANGTPIRINGTER